MRGWKLGTERRYVVGMPENFQTFVLGTDIHDIFELFLVVFPPVEQFL
jgi:hypothetical protein